LLVVVSFAGLIFGPKAAESQVVWQIQDLVGRQAAAGVQAVLEGTRHTTHGIIATVMGILTLLFGASGVLMELRDALNTIWEIPPAQTAGLRTIMQMVRERLFSFALVLAVGFLLLVSLVVNAAIAALGSFSARFLPIPEIFLHLLNAVFSFIVITALFAAIYKVMPETKIQWRDVFLGAAVTSLLFTVGKLLIGLYLGKASFASTYGAAASVVILIVWVYYSGQIFFLGAEFTKIFATRYGSQPNRHSTSIATSSQDVNSSPAVSARILAPWTR
jgi:membrane protein